VSRGQRGGSVTVVNLSFLSSSSSFILTRAEWNPFQTHCYSENLAALAIEPGTSGLAAASENIVFCYVMFMVVRYNIMFSKRVVVVSKFKQDLWFPRRRL
jgi:hypothetical protein